MLSVILLTIMEFLYREVEHDPHKGDRYRSGCEM
jgi:hypothetical protein